MNIIGKAGLVAATMFALMLSGAHARAYDGAGPGESTIGTDGDYPSLYAACEAISATPLSGGDWDFLILNDLNEPLNSVITQASSTSHTITLRPAPGVDATVTFTTTQAQVSAKRTAGHLTIGAHISAPGVFPTVVYVPTHYVTIDGSNTPGGSTRNLTFKNVAGDGARTLIAAMGGCENITVKNCILDSYGVYSGTQSGSPVSPYSNETACIDFPQENFDTSMNGIPDNVQNGGIVQNCMMKKFGTFSATAVSLNIIQQSPTFAKNPSETFTVTDNTITSFSVGIRTGGARNLLITNNTISPGNGSPHAEGMFIQPGTIGAVSQISGNVIQFPGMLDAANVRGIYTRELRYDCTTFLDNNTISGDFSSPSSQNAIGIYSEIELGSTVTLRQNSIAIHGTNSNNWSAGFYLFGMDSKGNAVLRNNVIRAGMLGCVAIRTEGSTSTLDSDYNNLFAIPGAYIGRSSGMSPALPDPYSMATWQQYSGHDTHSSNLDPYVSAGVGLGTWTGPMGSPQEDLHFTAYPGPAYLAPALAQVSTDIDSDPRPNDWAVMGADEMPHPPASVDEWTLY